MTPNGVTFLFFLSFTVRNAGKMRYKMGTNA